MKNQITYGYFGVLYHIVVICLSMQGFRQFNYIYPNVVRLIAVFCFVINN